MPGKCGGKGARRGVDGEVGLVDPSEHLGAGVDVDEPLARTRHLEQAVAVGGDLAECCADHDQRVCRGNEFAQRGRSADADVTGVVRMAVCRSSPGSGTTRRPAGRRLRQSPATGHRPRGPSRLRRASGAVRRHPQASHAARARRPAPGAVPLPGSRRTAARPPGWSACPPAARAPPVRAVRRSRV